MNSFRTLLQIRREVRQHATRQSLILLCLIVGLFFEAYMHNFNLVYITLFFLIAAAMAAIPLGLLNIGPLQCHFDGCGRLFAGKEGECRFRIENPASTTGWGVDFCWKENRIKLPPLPSRTSRTVAVVCLPKRRGRMKAGSCCFESLFPLATIRFVKPVEVERELVVFPEPKGVPLESFVKQSNAPYGHETDFDGLADYSGTENASRIHWPSVAKGETLVKHFEKERENETLIFDFQTCAGNDEARLSQLTLWVLECERRGKPFIIRLPGRVLESQKVGTDAILETLALY
ncbi:DUF58 domain-containing protein [Hydrogenimonas urashimensis]|uniref:DUF58 domain-containing protein n=1 Tax=Hydrogenimonas urashimensis TaxID=2740515 RepID=UPI0019158C8F|nr:DUF58 domain-containing protein [Hydrogenimonas urashimensis]